MSIGPARSSSGSDDDEVEPAVLLRILQETLEQILAGNDVLRERIVRLEARIKELKNQ